jgi:LacI family transcriptional regulator
VEDARRSGQPHVDSITGDEERGAGALIEHLIELGHRRIAMIAGPRTSARPKRGWKGSAGPSPWLLCTGRLPDPARRLRRRVRATATAAILREHPDVTAIFTSSSRAALDVLKTLRRQNRRIPDDMSVPASSTRSGSRFRDRR